MDLLIYEPSYRLIDQALAARGVNPIIMQEDGSLIDRTGKTLERAEPAAAWISRELLVPPGGPVGKFLKQIHGGSVRWVQSSAAGYEHPIFQQILAAGIRLTSSDATAGAIAEFVLAEVLASMQPLAERRASQQLGKWERHNFRELQGSRWLIVGYGHIGREVARRAQAFDARVTGIRRTPEPCRYADAVVGTECLDTELAQADVIVLSAAANAANEHLLNDSTLTLLQPGSILVNIARGSLIDETALLRQLDQGRPGLAILDVFETEPLPAESTLWQHPRVRLSAHSSADSDGTGRRGIQVFLEHLDAWLLNEPLRLEVPPARKQVST